VTGTATGAPRRGRPSPAPPGSTTLERLLDAATASCLESGFDGATIGDIANRAEVTTGAIYNHFSGRSALLVASARRALATLGSLDAPELEGVDLAEQGRLVARSFLARGFAPSRRLIAELHQAAPRNPELAELLAAWHGEQLSIWVAGGVPPASAKAYFLVLLGVCQLETLGDIDTEHGSLRRAVEAAAVASLVHPGAP